MTGCVLFSFACKIEEKRKERNIIEVGEIASMHFFICMQSDNHALIILSLALQLQHREFNSGRGSPFCFSTNTDDESYHFFPFF